MSLNITIAGDRSSSGEDDSSDGRDSPISESRSYGYHDPYDDEWERLPYPDEIKPSNATSRLRASREARTRGTIQSSRSGSGRPVRRRAQDREPYPRQESFSRRSRRTPSPDSPESVDSADDEYAYEMPQDSRRYWPPVNQGPAYPRGSSAGPSYPYAHGAGSHGPPYGRPGSSQPPSDQLIRVGHGQAGQSAYSPSMHPYGPQFPHHPGSSMTPFFPDHSGHPMHPSHHAAAPYARGRSHGSPQPMPPHGALPYGGLPMSPQELVPYGSNGYYPFRDPYAMVPEMTHPYFGPYPPRGASPPQPEARKSPDPPPADTAKDEAIARLEKLIMEERTEREAREARELAKKQEIEKEAAEQAAREERAAHEKQIAEEAAAAAKAEAEQKAQEEAAKAKQEADEAAAAAAEAAAEAATAAATEAANAAKAEAVAAAAAEATAAAEAAAAAAAAAAAEPPPPEKKKPIKFKDAIGRKFSFPFELCATWQGMEELIRQAFLHIDVIGPHVADGHYDLVGPNGDIILPQVWDTVVEPDWTIIMHMWPVPEKPKTPEPPPPAPAEEPPAEEPPAEAPAEPAPEAPAEPAPEAPAEEPPSEEATPDEIKKITAVTKRPRQKSGDPGAFAMWMVGGHRLKLNKNIKVEKKTLK